MLLCSLAGWQCGRAFHAKPCSRQRRLIMKIKTQFHADSDKTRKQPITYDNLTWVQCKGSRCLAYTDTKGQWINFYTGTKLTDFIEVIG